MNTLPFHTITSPEDSPAVSAFQIVAETTVDYYLECGGPTVARQQLEAFFNTQKFRNDLTPVYRQAMDRIIMYERQQQLKAEEQNRQNLSTMMNALVGAVTQTKAPTVVQPTLGSKTGLTTEQTNAIIRQCLELLMAERFEDNKPLFNRSLHWQAVYRILVDEAFCSDSDFDGFDIFIRRVMPAHVNKPYSKASVKQISQTAYVRPFAEWRFDPQLSKTRDPFDRMCAVADCFQRLLHHFLPTT